MIETRKSAFPISPPAKRYLPYLLLAALVVSFFWDLCLKGQTLALRDTFIYFPSWRAYARSSLEAGELPWWNPFTGFGKPFIADTQAAFFYPPYVLFHLLPLGGGLKVSWMLHLWIAGASMFALGRYWRLNVTPSLVAAVAFMFNSFLIAWMEFPSGFATLAWTPLVLLLLNRLADVWIQAPDGVPPSQLILRSSRVTGVLILILAVQFLAGHGEIFLFSCLFNGVFFLIRCTHCLRGWRIAGPLLMALSAGVIALCLVLPQLIPTLELLPYSERAATCDPALNFASVSPRHLLTLVFPFLDGRPGYPDKYWAGSIFEFWLGTCYFGLIPLLLIPWSGMYIREKGTHESSKGLLARALLVLALCGLVIAAGRNTPVAALLYQHVPVFTHLRFPSKFLMWFWYAGALLSGLGYQAFCDAAGVAGAPGSRRIARLAFPVLGLIVALGLVAIAAFPGWPGALTGRAELQAAQMAVVKNDYLLGLLFLGCGTALLAVRWFVRTNRWVADGLVLALVFINLQVVGRQIHPVVPDDIYTAPPDPALVAKFKSDRWRIHSNHAFEGQYLYGDPRKEVYEWARNAGVQDCWLPWGIYSTYSSGFKIVRNMQLYGALCTLPPEMKRAVGSFASVRYLAGDLSPDSMPLTNRVTAEAAEISNTQPRVFLVTHWWPAGEEVDLPMELVSSNAYQKLALVEPLKGPDSKPELLPAFDPAAPEYPLNDAIRVFQAGRNSVHLEVAANCRSLVVLNDTWYPGWKALVDGRERPIYRANFWFRGVFLEAGNHTLDFSYRPSHIGIATGVSLTSGSLLCLFLVWARLKLKASSATASGEGG